MHTSCRCHGTADRKSSKHMPGHDDAAVPETEHGNKDAEINGCLHDPQQSVFSFEQIAVPPDIQDIVCDEQHKHPSPKPLMKHLASDLIAHQAEQQHCHYKVDPHLYIPFCFHRPSVLSYSSDNPSSATHLSARLSVSDTLKPPGCYFFYKIHLRIRFT